MCRVVFIHHTNTCDYCSCVLTAFLALNGITEAFVYGVARSGNDVGKIGIAHAVVGGVFAFIVPSLVKTYGVVGLVFANCIAMLMRSMYSLHFARGYFAQAGKNSCAGGIFIRILPNSIVTMAFGVSFLITRLSRRAHDVQIADGRSWAIAGAQHICAGFLCVAMIAALSFWLEQDVRGTIKNLTKQKRL